MVAEVKNDQARPGAAAVEGEAAKARGVIREKLDALRSARPLTLEGRFEGYLSRCADRIEAGEFPEIRIAEVLKAICEFADTIDRSDCIARGNVDFYNIESARLRDQLTRLHRPPARPAERERIGPAIAKLWTGPRGCPEFDQLFAILTPEEQIVSFDWQGAVVSGPAGERTVTRRALRLRDRHIYSTFSEDAWVDRHGPIRPPEGEAAASGQAIARA